MSPKSFISTKNINLNNIKLDEITKIGKALSAENRVKIISLLIEKPRTISELADILALPISNITFHLDILEKASLIKIFPSGRSYKASLLTYELIINLKNTIEEEKEEVIKKEEEYEIPLGSYIEAHDITFKLEHKDKDGNILKVNNIYDEEKLKTELLFSTTGSVTFPLPNIKRGLKEIIISLELCSEAPFYIVDYPSEIFFLINDIEICSYISPGDLGGRRGNQNPKNYPLNNTQYGQLKTLIINKTGTFFDGVLLDNKINIDSINLKTASTNKLRIGNLPKSTHAGGFNIFGKYFGDYSQGIKVIYKY